MNEGSIARRYAKALMAIGLERGTSEQLSREVRSLAAAIKSSPELAITLTSPAFSRSVREQVLRAVLQRIGASPDVLSFTRLLLDRERVAQIPSISRELDRLSDERAGRIEAVVSSAAPLAPAQEQELLRRLEAMSGKKVQMKVALDPQLLGGVVVKLGDVVYDGSLRTQLQRMREELAG
jgi:F-type H+-transporting ATPase subunit delta